MKPDTPSGMAPAPPTLDHMLCFAVYSTGLAFNRVYKPLLDALGLTYPQYLVLLLLRETPDMSVGAIGERLFLESNTLTPLIKRMEAAALVSRRRDGDDERIVRVALTEKGKAIAQEAECVPAAILDAAGGDRASLLEMIEGLVRLRDTLRSTP